MRKEAQLELIKRKKKRPGYCPEGKKKKPPLMSCPVAAVDTDGLLKTKASMQWEESLLQKHSFHYFRRAFKDTSSWLLDFAGKNQPVCLVLTSTRGRQQPSVDFYGKELPKRRSPETQTE